MLDDHIMLSQEKVLDLRDGLPLKVRLTKIMGIASVVAHQMLTNAVCEPKTRMENNATCSTILQQIQRSIDSLLLQPLRCAQGPTIPD